MFSKLKKFCFPILSYLTIGYISSFISINYINPIKHSEPLPDLIFDITHQITTYIPHCLLVLYGIYFLINVEKDTLPDFFKKLTTIFTIRLFTFTLTALPPVLPNCYSRLPDEPLEFNVVKVLLLNDDNTCLDMMFSGHAVHFVAFSCMLLKQKHTRRFTILNTLYLICALLSISISHLHYSSDVLVAATITFLAFS